MKFLILTCLSILIVSFSLIAQTSQEQEDKSEKQKTTSSVKKASYDIQKVQQVIKIDPVKKEKQSSYKTKEYDGTKSKPNKAGQTERPYYKEQGKIEENNPE